MEICFDVLVNLYPGPILLVTVESWMSGRKVYTDVNCITVDALIFRSPLFRKAP